jgi:hypothetical protein
MNSFAIRSAIAASAISILAACGGGSSGGGGAATTGPTLNLNAAYASLLTNGSSIAWTLSGDCTGTSVETFLPAYNSFNYATTPVAVLAVNKVQVDSISSTSKALAACNQIYNSNDGNQVFTDFYNPTTKIIVNEGGDKFFNVYSDQAALPTSVTVGSSGTLYTSKDFKGASSTTGTPSQTTTVTYAVTADTATTLLVTLTNTGKDGATGKTLFTFNNTYRLNANNTLTPLSYSGTTTADLTGIGALSVSATAAAAPAPRNLGAAQIDFLSGASSAAYSYLNDGEQCGDAGIANTAISNSSSTRTFTTSNITDAAACKPLPNTVTTTYGSAFQVVSSVIAGTNSNNQAYTVTNTAKSTPVSTALPNNATVGALGTLYEYTSTNTQSPTGKVTYFVGAGFGTSLTVYEITTPTDGQFFRRQAIVSYIFNSDNTVAPGNVYLEDGSTLVPN